MCVTNGLRLKLGIEYFTALAATTKSPSHPSRRRPRATSVLQLEFRGALRARFPPGANQVEFATLQAKAYAALTPFTATSSPNARRKVSGRTASRA